jgi:nucleotide-binding universal stress UspA family protein
MSLTYIAAYDGTDASRSAVQFAVELARVERASVVAAHVYPFTAPVHVRGALPAADRELQEDARAAGRAVLDGLDVDGIARRVLACGSPAHDHRAHRHDRRRLRRRARVAPRAAVRRAPRGQRRRTHRDDRRV